MRATCLAVFLLVTAVITLSLQITGRANANPVNISRGYQASQALQLGSLVSLDPANNQKVILADTSNVNNLLGVVVSQSSSNINVTTSQSNVQIGTSGTYSVNVTDINGAISAGDELTASPIEGFAMKATTASKVIGTAQAAFSSKTIGALSRTVPGNGGKNVSINVGTVPTLVTSEYWPGPPATGFLNSFLSPVQSFLSSLTKKPVSQVKALICVILVSLSLLIAIVILLVTMLASIRSIGRNPLARRSITNHLIFVIILVMAIIGAGFSAAYLMVVG